MTCEIYEIVDTRSTANTGRYPVIGWCKTHDRPSISCLDVQAAVRAEREACAKVAEEYPKRPSFAKFEDIQRASENIASLIRGRGEK